ncbi:MAG: PKD domain-containing protein, partial [Gammaproteobacteria bacterium]
HSGNDQNGAPIISFTWQQQTASGSPAVDLVNRTNNTISFTAPEVAQATTLTFQLTVKDASGASATAQAQVAIQPVRDLDHFLSFLSVPDHVIVTAATSAPVTADTSAPYNAPIPYGITVTKLVTYTDMSGTQHSQVPVGQAVTYHGSWSAALGAGIGCADARNPQVEVPIPRLNLDDLLNDGSGHRLSDVMQTSDLDLDPANNQIPPAVVYAQVQIAPDPSAPAPAGVTAESLPQGVTPLVCVGSTGSVGTLVSVNDPGSISGATASATFSSDEALAKIAPGGLYDSSASAHAYYHTLDPTNAKTTLDDWLKVNGIDPSATNWGADTPAGNTNNFDLGLGRDMYLKVGACDSGYSAAPLTQYAAQTPLTSATAAQLQQLVGHC